MSVATLQHTFTPFKYWWLLNRPLHGKYSEGYIYWFKDMPAAYVNVLRLHRFEVIVLTLSESNVCKRFWYSKVIAAFMNFHLKSFDITIDQSEIFFTININLWTPWSLISTLYLRSMNFTNLAMEGCSLFFCFSKDSFYCKFYPTANSVIFVFHGQKHLITFTR